MAAHRDTLAELQGEPGIKSLELLRRPRERGYRLSCRRDRLRSPSRNSVQCRPPTYVRPINGFVSTLHTPV